MRDRPARRGIQRVLEAHRQPPAHSVHLLAVESIPEIMARARAVEIHQLVVERPAEDVSDGLCHLEVRHLAFAHNVVLLAALGASEKEECSGRDVPGVDVRPDACLGPRGIRVNRHLLAVEDLRDRHGDELLRVLALAENVHAVADVNRKFVGIGIRQAQLFGTGLGGRVRIAAVVPIPFLV